jgi:PII-like signaling protein
MVFVGESAKFHHKPLYAEIVHRAHAAGLSGATVLRGVEGFGGSGRIHTSRLLDISEDLPVVVVIVDDASRLDAFLAELDGIVEDGLVVVDDVETVRYQRER